MTVDRLSPLDAGFLHIEDGTTHMHIGSCAVFEGSAPTLAELRSMIESRLHLITRYRQKVRFVAGGWGHPVWVDDAAFRIVDHVEQVALPATVTSTGLADLMGQLMSKELDRSTALWRVWLVNGLEANRWALIWQVHHCMVDGVSGTGLMSVLLDAEQHPTTTPDVAEPWIPAPEPGGIELVADAMTRLAVQPLRALTSWASKANHPRAAVAEIRQIATGLRSLGERTVQRTPTLSIEGTIGTRRLWAPARFMLRDVKEVRAAFGGSVNDVVLSSVTGAFRRVLLLRGEEVDAQAVMHALVPVSVRAAEDMTTNNQVSLIVASLPIGIADPIDRLRSITAQMSALKGSHQADAGVALTSAVALVPPVLFSAGLHASMSLLRRMPQHVLNTVITNVPGPVQPLYAMGREMVEYLPFVPVSQGLRIGVAAMSYNGQMTIGITGDHDTIPEVHAMAEHIEAEVDELRRLARCGATAESATPKAARHG